MTKLPLFGLTLLALAACSSEKTCSSGEKLIGDTCYALQSDPLNCGSKGTACGAGQGCSAGACVDCTSTPGACTTDLLAACFDSNQVLPLRADLVQSGAPFSVDSGPTAFARLGTTLYVANSLSSTISAITLSPPSATRGANAIAVRSGAAGSGDLEGLAAHGGLLWAANSAAGTLVAIDAAKGTAVDEVALAAKAGDATRPLGIAFVDAPSKKAYVALSGTDEVAVVDVTTVPGVRLVERISLASLATPGALAGPSRLLATGGKVYVTLNNAFDASFAPVAGAQGRLAVIDPATDAVVGAATDLGLACSNPSGLAISGTTLWVGCGRQIFDPKTFAVTGLAGTALVPVELGGASPVAGTALTTTSAIGGVAICGERGYAAASESGTMISFDPKARTITSSTLVCPASPGMGSFVADVACAR